MPWKRGKVTFDDGTTYPAEMLVKDDGQVWNMKVYKDGGVVEEIDITQFSSKLGKDVEDIYPFSVELE